MPFNLIPNNPDSFDGKRDKRCVNTWMYQVEQYLHLVQMSNDTQQMSKQMKIAFASSLLSGTTANWWLMFAQNGQATV